MEEEDPLNYLFSPKTIKGDNVEKETPEPVKTKRKIKEKENSLTSNIQHSKRPSQLDTCHSAAIIIEDDD